VRPHIVRKPLLNLTLGFTPINTNTHLYSPPGPEDPEDATVRQAVRRAQQEGLVRSLISKITFY